MVVKHVILIQAAIQFANPALVNIICPVIFAYHAIKIA